MDTVPKEFPAQASKQTALPGEGNRSFSENVTGKEQIENLSKALNAAGKDKTEETKGEARIGEEVLLRGRKLHNESAVSPKATASRGLPGYLLNQVSRQIIRLRNAGGNELTLQLKPPHLGRMKLNIEQTAGGIKVGIIVESAVAKDMLLANTNDLKASLADQGLRLDKIDVESQADFGQSMAQAGRGFGRSANQKGRWVGRNQADTGSDSDTEAPTVNEADLQGVDSGRLNLVA
jgi:flagellar hook-length control protein FliK